MWQLGHWWIYCAWKPRHPPPSAGRRSMASQEIVTMDRLPPSTRGTTGSVSSAGGAGLGPIEGAAEKRRMLMEPRQMPIGHAHGVGICIPGCARPSRVRNIHPLTGIVRYSTFRHSSYLMWGRSTELQHQRPSGCFVPCWMSRNYFSDPDNVVAKCFGGKERTNSNASSSRRKGLLRGRLREAIGAVMYDNEGVSFNKLNF